MELWLQDWPPIENARLFGLITSCDNLWSTYQPRVLHFFTNLRPVRLVVRMSHSGCLAHLLIMLKAFLAEPRPIPEFVYKTTYVSNRAMQFGH